MGTLSLNPAKTLRKWSKHFRNPLPRRKRPSAAIKSGLPPGSMVYIGEDRSEEPVITVFDYNIEAVHAYQDVPISDLAQYLKSDSVTWINLNGVHKVEVVKEICEQFGVHPLTQEDLVNTTQRAKLEEFDGYLYLVLKMIQHTESGDKGEIRMEQVSLIMGQGFVITFQEQTEDVFQPVRERLQRVEGRIRRLGADYLFYALIDVIVSNYYSVVEGFETHIEWVEDVIHADATDEPMRMVQHLKRSLLFLRRSIFPMREVIGHLTRIENSLVDRNTLIYFQDVNDHVLQVLDAIDLYREMLATLSDLTLSLNDHRMNEVIKVLTIVSTIFIPLTFLAGIYGMNFSHMPELEWRYGYFGLLGIMLGVASMMLWFFRRKKWL